MKLCPRLARSTLAVALGGLAAMPVAASSENEALQREVRRLAERVAQLEAASQGGTSVGREEGLRNEKAQALSARIQDVELEVLSMRRQTHLIETVDGLSAGASMIMVAQHADGASTTSGKAESQLNYRADISVTLPGGEIGGASGNIFAHFRLGQGDGLTRMLPTYSGVNASGFHVQGASADRADEDEATVLLAQAWYQLDVPLGTGEDEADAHLELNIGKIDPFVFFDQNGIADDETARFLNTAFVHNPLLDAGGDAGVDAHGFTPGLRLAYHDDGDSPDWWRVSLGIFASGPGAHFDGSFKQPFALAQLEGSRQWLPGLTGNYRLYGWVNGQATAYANEFDADTERHAGWGLSVDQQVSGHATLFARYGRSTRGRVKFDQAMTLGGEWAGATWGRGQDRLGLAFGWLRASDAFRLDAPTLDADADGTPDFGFIPGGSERLAELYYTWQVNDRFALTPDLQWLSRPAGAAAAKDMTIVGLRMKMEY